MEVNTDDDKKFSLVSLLVVILVAISVVAAACAPAAPAVTLPEGAIKLSDVVPGMGEHWGIEA